MIVETMESETRRIFEEIRDSRSPFATWEIKVHLQVLVK
jgi:hypothetical protein